MGGRTGREAPALTRHALAAAILVAAVACGAAGDAAAAQRGKKIVVRDSEYGRMLFDKRKQAVYIFEKEETSTPKCYGQCAKAWPPVLSKYKPRAGDGVKKELLGRTTRRNGKRQVTYNGHPLYYYAHEDPGEVLCHDVFLNGGYWWAIGPGGKRKP